MTVKKICGWLLFLAVLSRCGDPAPVIEKEVKLETLADSMCYLLGLNTSLHFAYYNEADYRPDMFQKAMNDFLADREFRVNEAQKKDILQNYFRWARKYQQDSVLRVSERFLAENAKRPEVIETPRGSQYEYVNRGPEEGISPDGNDVVAAIYRQGTPQKGILWEPPKDSPGGDTTLFALNQMYSGVSEIVQHLKKGDEVKIWLHPRVGTAENDDPLKVLQKFEVLYAEVKITDIIERSAADISEELSTRPGYFLDESRREN